MKDRMWYLGEVAMLLIYWIFFGAIAGIAVGFVLAILIYILNKVFFELIQIQNTKK